MSHEAVMNEFKALRSAAVVLRRLNTETKNKALKTIAVLVQKHQAEILAANGKDLTALGPETQSAFRERLTLTEERIQSMCSGLLQLAEMPDPVGEVIEDRTLANGLRSRRVRAPLGVIFMIFESRPNVILEAFSLAFKSGNAIALRGGSESKHTAQVLYRLMREGLALSQVSVHSFFGIDDYDRELVAALLRRNDLIDVVVPRGGERLIEFVQKTALMAIMKHDRGLCHIFVDDEVDLPLAVRVVHNAKTQRPGVCNSTETVLVHRRIAPQFLPLLYSACESSKLLWKCDPETLKILQGRAHVEPALEKDWDTEHLAQIINARVVDGLDQAMEHISKHGSQHSEAILTTNENRARRFQNEVDAAVVLWNASTRFTDGFELGLGGELGISTQKLHVRGPVGLRELTTPRWVIDGNGQIRS